MGKLLLLSVVIATISIPILSSREANPSRALKKTVFWVAIFDLFYLLALRFVYSHVQ